MKIKFFSIVLSRKRGIIFFAAAFVLPLLLAVGISVDTFSKRHETNRNLLESNLWYSGHSAQMEIEDNFIRAEKKILAADCYRKMMERRFLFNDSCNPGMFLLDADFNMVYPGNSDDPGISLLSGQNSWSKSFSEALINAQNEEKIFKNSNKAVRLYRQAISLAKSDQEKAVALEGIARINISAGKYPDAEKQYLELAEEYKFTCNLSGHPYGLTAPLQLYFAGQKTGRKMISENKIKETYHNLRYGMWPIGISPYYFFEKEYQDILNNPQDQNNSPYEEALETGALLTSMVLPRLHESYELSGLAMDRGIKMIIAGSEDKQYLVSIDFSPDSALLNYFPGLISELDILPGIFAPIITNAAKQSGLELLMVDNNDNNIMERGKVNVPPDALKLSLEKLPIPWSIIAIQPGFSKLKSDIKLQLIVYGVLLALILLLMVFGVIMIFRDITRESESMLLKTEFVHNVSHELKTPLSLIRLYGETLMLRKNLDEKEVNDSLQIITKESERLSHMINNILDFSKMEMGKKEFDIKEDRLADVVSETIDSYRYHLEKKGFEIHQDLNQDIPPVKFDRNAIEGIIINLLDNAIKYSTENKWVKISIKKDREQVVLKVEDHGDGIQKIDLPHIFDRFYQSRQGSKGKATGSGLGLTLVKHIVESHRWEIRVESIIGEGTTFCIIIPITSNKEVGNET